MLENNTEKILILDFGSQYAQLIARRVRENNVYSEIVAHTVTSEQIKKIRPKGIILSGGPASVYSKNAPTCDKEIVKLGIPILGICYGMQLGCMMLGSKVSPTTAREYGRTLCTISSKSNFLKTLPHEITVWMSHGDIVAELSAEFESIAHTNNCPYAVVKHKNMHFYGVQFHPEVTHTPNGSQMIRNFLYEICNCSGNWKMDSFIEKSVSDINKQVGNGRVVCGLSGGVDSAVTAALINKAIGNHLSCIFVDNGLLRNFEAEEVIKTFEENFSIDLHVVRAQDRFMEKLKGIFDPEKKRKIIGHEFIEVFKNEAQKLSNVKFLAQGTLYPDVIESIPAHGGPTVTIKSHHNVGGLPKELGFELVEPLRFLFKDEVRKIGEELGLPKELVWRHPFPGPGLAIRIIGEITQQRLEVLRNADKIVIEEIRKAGLYDKIAQCFAVLLPLSTVGVMGDERSYENVIAVRAVETIDFMTADWYRIPGEVLGTISHRIINEVKGVNRVVYDISTKPPSTIEWE
ncbi:MAG: glutamine-hydrolyzing GMP synthase [Planctomycetes bacterium]|nr:glutamine-hydrolyzing GMP synthase [Planctomycetota bacterium]